tara:strand:- start:1165 stop:2580 length:1416 start_codon:yes stop_codon:yes gene_type:complete
MFPTNKKNILFLSIIFVLIGIFLRTYQLNFENYWLDEMISFWVADPSLSFSDTFSRRDQIEQSPILFDLILKKYLEFFGYNPEIGRHVPLIFGILSIPLLGVLSYQVSKNNSFLLSILLISINIYLIKYSQETRPYSLVFFLSTVNLIFYYKIISTNITFSKKIFFFLLFVIFSVVTFSSHPFTFILFFSQILNSLYFFLFFKKKNYLFFLSIPIILLIYLFLNFDYIISQLSYNEFFLSHESWKFFYNYYFSRFFGSKIMGLVYLSTLIYLIITFRKKLFLTLNNYLVLVFVFLFSYIVPLVYSYLKTPILTDRYIIFVLIPILILISSLIFEIENKKIKIFLLVFILVPTIINNYIEIKYRIITKPEFTKFLNNIEKDEFKNLTINVPIKKELKVVENYIASLNEFKTKNFKIYNINKVSKDEKIVWVVCYEPLVGFDCTLPTNKENKWKLVKTIKNHLLNVRLFKIAD